MDNIVQKLSEIDHAAEAVVTHAEAEKANLEKRIQDQRDAFDAELEKKTQKDLDDIKAGMERQMADIMARQNRRNDSAIKKLEQDFEEKHTAYAKEVVRHIIEG